MNPTKNYEPLPDDLIDAVPGSALATRLWALDPSSCNGFQLIEVVRAKYRQICADQAHLLLLLRELACSSPCDPDSPPSRRSRPDDHADNELARAVKISNSAASEWLALAEVAVVVAPTLHRAMLSGEVDLPKLRMFMKEFAGVEHATAEAAVVQLRPELAGHTVGQLRHRLRRVLSALDPTTAARRVARARARRLVRHENLADGTANLSGVSLPAAKVAAAWENIDAIARTTHAAGDPQQRNLDQLRADVFADLLAGRDATVAGAGSTPRSHTYIEPSASTVQRPGFTTPAPARARPQRPAHPRPKRRRRGRARR